MAQILELRRVQPALGTSRFRVLLVDPVSARGQETERWLKSDGDLDLDLVLCTDSDDGASALRNGSWDLVIADVDVLDVPGGTKQNTLPLGCFGPPLLLLAQRLEMDVVQTALRNHAEAMLFHPLDPEALRTQVKALAHAHDARQRVKREPKVVLAIGAHPDDVEIGCGGALVRHRSKGDRVVILTLSHGASGGDVAVRARESARAAHLLDAKLRMAELPDTNISDGIETISLIESAVRELSPTYVYTHSIHDAHQDHRSVHRATMVAARTAPNLYCYQSPSSTTEFQPNLFIDISDHIEQKVAAIAAFESQVRRSASLHPDAIRASAAYWGRYAAYSMVEPMEVIRRLVR